MNKALRPSTIIIAASMLLMSNCLKAQTLTTAKDGYTYHYYFEKNKAVIADEFDNVIIPASLGFKYIHYVSNEDGDTFGYFKVVKGKKYGAYDIYGHEIVPPLSSFPYGNCYNYQLNGQNIGCALDASGDFIISPERGYEEVSFTAHGLYKGYFEVAKDGLVGVCDIFGNEFIPPTYQSVFYDSTNDVFQVRIDKKHYQTTNFALREDGSFCTKEERDDIDGALSIEELYQAFLAVPDNDYRTKNDYYNKIMRLDSTDTKSYTMQTLNEMGAFWERRNAPKLSISYYERMLKIDPNSTVAKDNLERAKMLVREKRNDKWMNALDNVANVMAGVGSAIATFTETAGGVSTVGTVPSVSYTTSTGTESVTQTANTRSNDVDELEKKAAQAKEEAQLKPLFYREQDVYSNYASMLHNMELYPQKYDDQHRQRIQSTMKQIREKWEQKGYKITRSEWESWKPEHVSP